MTAAIPTPAALSPAEQAVAFLKALGKDPAKTYFRTLQQGTQPNRRRSGRDLLGFDLEGLVRDNASQSVYVVVGNATGATGADRKTGRPTGAVIDEDCPTVSAVFVEWDSNPIDWQRNAWKELGLPEPSLTVATGGKSVHCYWVLREPMPAAEWRQLQARLIEHCDSDRSCKNPSRVMRLPGFAYIDKATGKPTDNRAEIIHNSGARYSVRELEQCIPAGTATPAPLPLLQAPRPAPMVSGAPVPFRDFITKAAAELIETGSREGSCNDDGLALSMELVAVEAWLQAQGAQADETARDAYACYLSHCPDTINGSPFDTRAAWARFEGAADQRPTPGTPEDKLLTRLAYHRRKAAQPASNVIQFSGARNPLVDEVFKDESATGAPPSTRGGSQGAKQGSRRSKRKPPTLSLSRRLDCFRHCCAALVTTERNTLRRMARLRHAVGALDLRSVVTSKELGAQVLEAQDRRAGNTFSLLTAADREAMPKPVIRWLIPGLIPCGDLTIIGGRPKVGKTRLAVAAARALLLQEDFLGFGTPPTLAPVILVSDDQGDADTFAQLERLRVWDHPRLLWVRRFRVTEHDLDMLHDAIKGHPGAVVIVDSLRSITRSCPFKEDDSEMGALLYDLKQGVMDAGGSLVLIHHCNKSTDGTGTEALSGHSAIAGAANSIITMHYLSGGKVGSLLLKDIPERRLAMEGRSGPGCDLVIAPDGTTGQWVRVAEHSAWQEQQKTAGMVSEVPNSEDQAQVLETVGGLSNPQGSTVREIAEVIHGPEPQKAQLTGVRKQCASLRRQRFLEEVPHSQPTRYRVRSSEEG